MSRPRRTAEVAWVEVDDAVVALDARCGAVHVLDPTAAAAWLRFDGTSTLADIVADLADRYDVDPATVAHDVEALLDHLVELGVLDLDQGHGRVSGR